MLTAEADLRYVFSAPPELAHTVSVVAGETYGVGRGIARALAAAGSQVFITGRSAADGAAREDGVVSFKCDHRNDEEVSGVFEKIAQRTGGIDLLVNNVWGGYEHMIEDGAFTWAKPFWEQPTWRWDAMFDAGVRARYYASQLAARSMV